MKPKLNEAALYSGDNGRIFCGALKCAGTSNHFTGRGIGGQRAMKIDAGYLAEAAKLNFAVECEDCGRKA